MKKNIYYLLQCNGITIKEYPSYEKAKKRAVELNAKLNHTRSKYSVKIVTR